MHPGIERYKYSNIAISTSGITSSFNIASAITSVSISYEYLRTDAEVKVISPIVPFFMSKKHVGCNDGASVFNDGDAAGCVDGDCGEDILLVGANEGNIVVKGAVGCGVSIVGDFVGDIGGEGAFVGCCLIVVGCGVSIVGDFVGDIGGEGAFVGCCLAVVGCGVSIVGDFVGNIGGEGAFVGCGVSIVGDFVGDIGGEGAFVGCCLTVGCGVSIVGDFVGDIGGEGAFVGCGVSIVGDFVGDIGGEGAFVGCCLTVGCGVFIVGDFVGDIVGSLSLGSWDGEFV
jgi:hypothetical protein